MGKFTSVPCVSSMSRIQSRWDSAESTDSAITLMLRSSNSGFSFATRPSSVVHTGVKSAGCENSTPHLVSSHAMKKIRPTDESCSKSGAMLPM